MKTSPVKQNLSTHLVELSKQNQFLEKSSVEYVINQIRIEQGVKAFINPISK